MLTSQKATNTSSEADKEKLPVMRKKSQDYEVFSKK